VADALGHRLGVPEMPQEVTPERLQEWDWIVSLIAAQAPSHPPGAVNAYHPLTFGWVLGEVVRRTDPQHRPFGQFVQDELCGPLGIDDLWLGVPADRLDRVARLEAGSMRRELPPERVALRSKVVPPALAIGPDVFNRADVRTACVPAAGLTANARSVARLFALLAGRGELDGVRLLSEERVLAFTQRRPHYDDLDQTNFYVMPLGAHGYWLADAVAGSHPNLICSVGAGGSIAWADLDTGLAVAICHNRMFGDVPPGEHPLVPVGDAVRELARGLAHTGAR
jgi:CubicO group peptidase (beta-lactamase class C family)